MRCSTRHPPRPAALRPGRVFSRHEGVAAGARHQARLSFFNLPDMDFGRKDAAFVPFFGVPAATLLAPSRMARSLNMVVQPVVAEMLPGGQGYRVRFLPPGPTGPPTTPRPTPRA
jgi:KDO2-lipid IV(A) lauroyltransferase